MNGVARCLNVPLLGAIMGRSFNTPCPRIVEMKDSANGHAWSYSELGGFHSGGKCWLIWTPWE
jgi:hypothetical protein